IRLAFEGSVGIKLDPNGDLLLDQGSGSELRFRKPVAYQRVHGLRHQVPVEYALDGHDVSFKVGDYDRANMLVIDPVLVYSTFLNGSNGASSGSGIAVDANGNAWVTGQVSSTDFPTVSPFQPGHASVSPYDAFVSKLNAAGSALLFSSYLG